MSAKTDRKSRRTWSRIAVAVQRLVRILTGDNLRRLRELEAAMKHWHKEESTALDRAQEAIACGNMERADMWARRCREARLRCEKDFRRPMIELTGKPDLFDANAEVKCGNADPPKSSHGL